MFKFRPTVQTLEQRENPSGPELIEGSPVPPPSVPPQTPPPAPAPAPAPSNPNNPQG